MKKLLICLAVLVLAGDCSAQKLASNIPLLSFFSGTVQSAPTAPTLPSEPPVGASVSDWQIYWQRCDIALRQYANALTVYAQQNYLQVNAALIDPNSLRPDAYYIPWFVAAALDGGKTGPTVLTEAQAQLKALKAALSAPPGTTVIP